MVDVAREPGRLQFDLRASDTHPATLSVRKHEVRNAALPISDRWTQCDKSRRVTHACQWAKPPEVQFYEEM